MHGRIGLGHLDLAPASLEAPTAMLHRLPRPLLVSPFLALLVHLLIVAAAAAASGGADFPLLRR